MRRPLALALALGSLAWPLAGVRAQGGIPERGYSAVADAPAFSATAVRPPVPDPVPQTERPQIAQRPPASEPAPPAPESGGIEVATAPPSAPEPATPEPLEVARVPSSSAPPALQPSSTPPAPRLPVVEPPKPVRVPAEFDVFIAIDVSASTKRPSGVDVDGDGTTGRIQGIGAVPLFGGLFDQTSDDPGDSVLAVEIEAAKRLLEQIDQERARVGIIAFSGTRSAGRATEPDARVVAPLTRDYNELQNRLDELLASGSRDEANLMAAVQLVSGEFERGFKGDPDRDVGRIGLLISHGRATLPALLSAKARAGAAVQAARDAAKINARIYTYAVGTDRNSLDALQQIADVTEGGFSAMGSPDELVSQFENLDLARIAALPVE